MRLNTSHWRAIRRYFLVFTAIALLPLALVYLVRNEQIYRIKGYDILFRVWENTNSRCFLKNKLGTYEAENRVNLKMKANDKIKDFRNWSSNASFDTLPDENWPGQGTFLEKCSSVEQEILHQPGKTGMSYRGNKYVNESHVPVLPEESVHTLSPNDVERVEKRMERRRKLLQEKCAEFGLDVVGNDTWHKPNAWEFLVNKKYHIIWCNVFKAASSSWMFNFNVLAGYSPEFLQRTKEVFLNLARERYPRVTIEQLREAQNDSITFMIARHPFERLLSAYRDKMVFAIPHSYHDKLGRRIVRKYRRKNQDINSPKYPTFAEFVRWLLDQTKHTNSQLDMHFVSSTMFCTPCVINFDVIMKFDTLDEDQLYLINKTGLTRVIAPEWRNAGKGKNTQELLHSFYSKLTPKEMNGLYQYYKYDFELFNYSASSYFNMVQENGT